ncbi:TPA: hypothetical protein ACUNCG_003705 [Aeromonas hydrophila]
MNSIKFNAAQQAEGLVLSAFWGESLRHDHQRLYSLQSRLAVLRIRRRVRGLRDKAQVRVLLRQCRQARTTLRHANARLMRVCIVVSQ